MNITCKYMKYSILTPPLYPLLNKEGKELKLSINSGVVMYFQF